jgi:hypothetical protein
MGLNGLLQGQLYLCLLPQDSEIQKNVGRRVMHLEGRERREQNCEFDGNLTLRSSVLLEKLIVSQLFQVFLAAY